MMDEICERFENAIRESNEPGIRAELDRIGPRERQALFRKLLGLQLAAIADPDHRPGFSSLLAEFQEFAREILEVCPTADEEVKTIACTDLHMGDWSMACPN